MIDLAYARYHEARFLFTIDPTEDQTKFGRLTGGKLKND